MHSMKTNVLEAWDRGKTEPFGDWHIQRVPCQSQAQSISSSQSVLFVCWICFGTRRPLIDTGARAGKTFLWCEVNNGASVSLPQMFGLGGFTDIIVVQKSGHFPPCSHSPKFLSISLIWAALKLSLSFLFKPLNLVSTLDLMLSCGISSQKRTFCSFLFPSDMPGLRNLMANINELIS